MIRTEKSDDVALKGKGGGVTDLVNSLHCWHIWNNTDGGSHTGHFVLECEPEGELAAPKKGNMLYGPAE